MRRAAWILAISMGCATPNGFRHAIKPLPMALEKTTTLQVGEVAVLHIPSDRHYLHSANGAWRDVLALLEQSGRDVTFRAVRPGLGVIIISPDVPDQECISCATLHYFVKVVSQE
jgi:hypothetical protein